VDSLEIAGTSTEAEELKQSDTINFFAERKC
jgi:hypothetical protein